MGVYSEPSFNASAFDSIQLLKLFPDNFPDSLLINPKGVGDCLVIKGITSDKYECCFICSVDTESAKDGFIGIKWFEPDGGYISEKGYIPSDYLLLNKTTRSGTVYFNLPEYKLTGSDFNWAPPGHTFEMQVNDIKVYPEDVQLTFTETEDKVFINAANAGGEVNAAKYYGWTPENDFQTAYDSWPSPVPEIPEDAECFATLKMTRHTTYIIEGREGHVETYYRCIWYDDWGDELVDEIFDSGSYSGPAGYVTNYKLGDKVGNTYNFKVMNI